MIDHIGNGFNNDDVSLYIEQCNIKNVANVVCSRLNSTVMIVGWSSSSHAPLNVDSVHYIAGRSNANVSWIFLDIPPEMS